MSGKKAKKVRQIVRKLAGERISSKIDKDIESTLNDFRLEKRKTAKMYKVIMLLVSLLIVETLAIVYFGLKG